MEETKLNTTVDDRLLQSTNNPNKCFILETDEEKRTRQLSLKIIYFTMFLMTLGFSIILTSIWPYLDKVGQCE